MVTASSASELGTLTYASPEVRTSPPRTVFRVIGATALYVLGLMLGAVRLCFVALGYAVLGAGVMLRFALALVAMILLFVGGLRWDVVKRRTLGAAQWVDVKVLATLAWFRRVALPRSGGSGGGR